MRTIATWTLFFSLGASFVNAQRLGTGASDSPIQLGRARPSTAWNCAEIASASKKATHSRTNWPVLRVVRGQAPDIGSPPPPPPPPGSVGVAGPNDPFDCGMVTEPPVKGGFFSRTWDNTWKWVKGIPDACAGAFQGRNLFQSDHSPQIDQFSSPVSNPFYMEDPRALTEISPLFIWQNTPGDNPGFAGGDNFFFGFRGSVAVTPRVSLVLHKLGWTWVNPEPNPLGFTADGNFSEIHLGPKVTIIRSEQTQSLLAAGLAFEIPTGSNNVFQNTGTLTLRPYVSFAQNFFRTTYGSFNFMNTTGYAFGTDSQRTDFFFSSFHLDFNVGNFNRFYPMIELNWFAYTSDGGARVQNFDGADLFNFGATAVSGLHELGLAFGGRYKFTEAIQAGMALEFDVLGGSRRLNDFRLTADLIFRY